MLCTVFIQMADISKKKNLFSETSHIFDLCTGKIGLVMTDMFIAQNLFNSNPLNYQTFVKDKDKLLSATKNLLNAFQDFQDALSNN
jgi:hypothetical protein